MIQYKIKALFNPDLYHGWGLKRNFFEGWYFKCVNKDQSEAIAIIPGIAMDKDGSKQAFIQVLDGKRFTAEYVKFPFSAFKASPKAFDVEIDENHFMNNSLDLNLPNLKGSLSFHNQVPWPSSMYSPGIMGPFAFVPFMECYHGILSLDHSISGTLKMNDRTIDFNGGRGYMEKDWGHSFPSAYFWMQSNHFSKTEISVKASVAKIPWLGSSFVGFIAGLYIEGKLIQFTTYNQSKLVKSSANENEVCLQFINRKYELIITAVRHDSTELASPIAGFMDGRIKESMTAELRVKLINRKNRDVIFEDTGMSAGLEVAGQIDQITIP